MTAQPAVSVIIPVYNDPDHLRFCLTCLGQQSYPRDRAEVIVVDNGSRESVAPIVAEFPFARIVEEPQPSQYSARNRGVREAAAEVLAFTDADCLPSPRWLENGVEMLLSVSNCGLVAGAVDLFPLNRAKPTATELYGMLYQALGQSRLTDQGKAVTANLFTFRRVFESVGPFKEGIKTGGDIEWARRVAAAGYTLAFCQEALIRHPARRTLREVFRRALRAAGGEHQKAHDAGLRRIRFMSGMGRQLLTPQSPSCDFSGATRAPARGQNSASWQWPRSSDSRFSVSACGSWPAANRNDETQGLGEEGGLKALVLGGNGFIGRHLSSLLADQGHEVIVGDLASTLEDCEARFPFLAVDICDRATVYQAVGAADVVLHCAGVLGTVELFTEIDRAIAVNIGGTATVLQACLDFSRPLVYVTLSNEWLNPYSITKQAAARFCEMFRERYGLSVATVVGFNTYGEGQKTQEINPASPRKLVPSFVVRALRGEPLEVFGGGEQQVDLIYAGDVASLLARVAGRSGVFQAGTGNPLSVNEVAAKVLHMTASNSGVVHRPVRPGEPARSVSVADDIRSSLATRWRPRVTLDDGLARTIEHYRKVLSR